MQPEFRRVLSALDLSSMDEEIIRYLAEVHQHLGIEQIYFVHIMPDFTAPVKEDARFHRLFNPDYPVDEKVKKRLENKVSDAFAGQEAPRWTVEVIEGKPYQKLMHWIEVKDIDLLAVGRKPVSEGSGITAKRIARHSDTHVLFVTPRAKGKWRELLIPIDFSDHSARALLVANRAKTLDPQLRIRPLYVVEMPLEDYYHPGGMPSGYRPLLMESAETAYQNFLEKYQLPEAAMEMEFLENDYGNISAHIAAFAKQAAPDLLLIGAQGHSGLDRFLYGSVTEKILEKTSGLPILIVR